MTKNGIAECVTDTELRGILSSRLAYLEQMLIRVKKEQRDEPPGKLRIAGKVYPQYYQILSKEDTIGRYIRKGDIALAMQLAQKGYHAKLVRSLESETKAIQSLLFLMDSAPESVIETLAAERKKLITPQFVTDEMYKQLWNAESFITDPYYPEALIYETKQGEKVRSKSEMLIADAYYELGIPYRYEAKLDLKNGMYRYPDFTVLNVSQRKVIYHEHFGLMDVEEYRNDAFLKLEQYREAGIYPGKNLIVTYETREIPINIKSLKRMFRELFLP